MTTTATAYLDSLSWDDFRRTCSNADIKMTGNREQVRRTHPLRLATSAPPQPHSPLTYVHSTALSPAHGRAAGRRRGPRRRRGLAHRAGSLAPVAEHGGRSDPALGQEGCQEVCSGQPRDALGPQKPKTEKSRTNGASERQEGELLRGRPPRPLPVNGASTPLPNQLPTRNLARRRRTTLHNHAAAVERHHEREE